MGEGVSKRVWSFRPNALSILHISSSFLFSHLHLLFLWSSHCYYNPSLSFTPFILFHSMASSTTAIDAPPQPINQNNAGAVSHKSRVTVVGSGNWGSVAAKLIASNTLKLCSFHDEVRMWVFEEKLPSGEKLTDVINRTNENVKYLPGIKLGKNVIADPDLENAVKDANMLVFVTPHQFMEGICKGLVGKLQANVEGISLIKGMEVKKEGPRMISALISKQLGINCCVLMGANIANEIAQEKFSEATVGYRQNRETAEKWVQLFRTPYFMVTAVQDVEGVELCGTLKNVVAIAAGFVDGLDMGNNTKAAVMRIGLREMRVFSKLLFPSVKDNTFFESCGVADLITTCLGGRNRKVAEAFAKSGGKRSLDKLEAQMLQGQKLQGVSTAKEVYEVLTHRGWLELFPFFATVNEICIGRLPPSAIVEYSDRTHKVSML
ncbi:glycerol-3-phosphate dehydrogenase [Tripterygium wilfordii]|uniref:Glycerol-3-phosphate dehydrogenase [NAD(+)] n=1 Tax=Tripterygium wilfordii TaxID=458696 RepID=A0A7J7D275_TRIWF|nr:glycerol-3-phosphate dehydrogenase [NAD(+)]-like [Tripterygium wilfordii]KAF5740431.1 glycerol-3-phosphate dehydrogenase [Tripterygium wilfordii]